MAATIPTECPTCAAGNIKSLVKLYQVNLEEAAVFCENKKCPFPLFSSDVCPLVIPHKLQCNPSKPKKKNIQYSLDTESLTSNCSASSWASGASTMSSIPSNAATPPPPPSIYQQLSQQTSFKKAIVWPCSSSNMSSASIGSVGSSFTDQEVDFELPNSEVDFNLCMGMTPSPLTNSQHDVPVPDDIAAFIEETFGSFGTDIQPLSTDDQSQGVTLQDALINTNSVTSCTDSSKPAEEVQVITLDDDDDVVEFSNKEPTDVAEPVDDKTQDVSLNLALGKTSKKVAPLFEVLDATLDDLAESVFSNQEDGWAGCKPVTQQRAEAVKNQEIAVNVSKQVTEELMPGYSNIELPGKRPVAKRKPKTVKKAVKKVVVPEELAPVTVEKPGPDATSSVSFQLSETGIPVFTIPLPTSAAKAARPKPSPVDLSSTTTTKRQKLRESQAAATKPKTQTPAKNKKKEPFDLQKIIKSFKSKR